VRALSHVLFLLCVVANTEPKQVYGGKQSFISERTIKYIIIKTFCSPSSWKLSRILLTARFVTRITRLDDLDDDKPLSFARIQDTALVNFDAVLTRVVRGILGPPETIAAIILTPRVAPKAPTSASFARRSTKNSRSPSPVKSLPFSATSSTKLV